jgi:hypothetical protein
VVAPKDFSDTGEHGVEFLALKDAWPQAQPRDVLDGTLLGNVPQFQRDIYRTTRKGSVINGRYKIVGCFVKFSNERVRQTTLVSCVTAGLGPARWQAIAWAKDDADRLPRCRYVSRWRVPRIAESS